jgi:hypothetical protein
MKKTIYFIAGILFTALISATTVSVMTVKPDKPKITVVITTAEGSSDFRNKIYNYIKQGYVVKSVAGTSQYGYSWVAVMEKY